MFFNWFGWLWNLQVLTKYGPSIFTADKRCLIQHIRKSAYVSGHIWGGANLPNKIDESLNWISSIRNDKILCTWISPNNTPLPENLVKIAFKKCGCRLKCQNNCNYKKEKRKRLMSSHMYMPKVWCFIIEKWYISLCFCTFLWTTICLPWIKFNFNLQHWLCFSILVSGNVFA